MASGLGIDSFGAEFSKEMEKIFNDNMNKRDSSSSFRYNRESISSFFQTLKDNVKEYFSNTFDKEKPIIVKNEIYGKDDLSKEELATINLLQKQMDIVIDFQKDVTGFNFFVKLIKVDGIMPEDIVNALDDFKDLIIQTKINFDQVEKSTEKGVILFKEHEAQDLSEDKLDELNKTFEEFRISQWNKDQNIYDNFNNDSLNIIKKLEDKIKDKNIDKSKDQDLNTFSDMT